MQENNSLEIISEKILQEKIKFLVWNYKIDIMIICYEKSYELHRLGYKHEEIFKREEKCEILDLKFIEEKEILAIFLSDKTVNFVDYSKGDFLLKHKFSKNKNFSTSKIFDLNKKESKSFQNILNNNANKNNSENQNFFNMSQNFFSTEIFYPQKINNSSSSINNNKNNNILYINEEEEDKKENFSVNEIITKNPFFKDLTFNSFSKIDISHLNFLNNKFYLAPAITLDKSNNNIELELTLGHLIKLSTIKLNPNQNIFDIKFLDKNIFILLENKPCEQIQQISSNLLSPEPEFKLKINFLNLDFLGNSYNDISLFSYLVYTSVHIIEYINNIFGIFNKIFIKLGIILFDKYIFANNLEHQINTENEKEYKQILNKQLKNLFYLGSFSDDNKIKNLLDKDLFEGNSINKLDENIHFNLKNIEDIIIENIKPSINTLIYNYNQIKLIQNNFGCSKNIQNNNIQQFIFSLGLNQDEKLKKNFWKYDKICENIYNKFEEFIIEINELKLNYRNFLGWIYTFNPIYREKEKDKEQQATLAKNILTANQVDYNRLFYFINDTSYEMNNLCMIIDNNIEGNSNNTINLGEKEENLEKNILKHYSKSIKGYDRFLYLNLDKDEKEKKSNFKILENVMYKNSSSSDLLSNNNSNYNLEFKNKLENLVKNSKFSNKIKLEELFINSINTNKNNFSTSNQTKLDEEQDISNKENIINEQIPKIHQKKKRKILKRENSNIEIDDLLIKKENILSKDFYSELVKNNEIKFNSLKNLLVELKDFYVNLNSEVTKKISDSITFENILTITGLNQNCIKKISWMEESPCYFPYFQEINSNLNTKNKFFYMEKILFVWYYDSKTNFYNIVLFHFVFKILNKKKFDFNKEIDLNLNQKNLQVEKVSFIKFPINFKNISILDFCIHKNKNLLFLVKTIDEKNENLGNFSPMQNLNNINVSISQPNITGSLLNEDNKGNDSKFSNSYKMNKFSNEKNCRFTLIVSEIYNYNFENIEFLNNNLDENNIEINIQNLSKGDQIKIDKFIDLDCSENSYISPGKRSFISLIDVKKNKISIIDI